MRSLAVALAFICLLAGCLGELPDNGGKLPSLDGAALSNLQAEKLIGKLPALDGSALTKLDAAMLTGRLPALDGSSLTGLNTSSACCRLSLSSSEPVPTAAEIAGTPLTGDKLYFLPYLGNSLPIYDGASWVTYTIPDGIDSTLLSIAIPATANTVYDVFAYSSGGAAHLELGGAWPSDTARPATLAQVRGIYVKANDPTRRYLGTFRTTVARTTEDSAKSRLVWNVHNRVVRRLVVNDPTERWTISVAWSQGHTNPANQVAVVVGLSDEPIELQLAVAMSDGGSGCSPSIKLVEGTDPAAFETPPNVATQTIGGSWVATLRTSLVKTLSPGYHTIMWAEMTGNQPTACAYVYGTKLNLATPPVNVLLTSLLSGQIRN